ncbi:MAG: 5-formyltetrahydrofolate cyclo-ligase [Pseudomonadota bacterium]
MTGPADLAAAKAEARGAAFARRKAAHARHREAASGALAAALDGVAGQVIAGYLPIRTEADPLPAMEALAPANRLCVPVVEGPGQPLTFRQWSPGCALVEGPFRVMVPAAGAELVPNYLIVPMVAFDAGLYRLGYGGGFYDRTLERLRVSGHVRAIGLAYAAQGVERLPLEPTDQPLDEIVTETGTLR